MLRPRGSAPPIAAPALIAAAAIAGCSESHANDVAPDAALDADHLTPFVIHYVPSAGDVTVAPDVTVTATFNKPVTNISSFSFTLTRQDTESLVAAFVEYDPVTRTASLDPQQAALDRTRSYVATLTPDVVDTDGAPLVGTTSWIFSIAPDTTAPEIITISPMASASNVAVDTIIAATFSEPLAKLPPDSFILEGPAGPVAATLEVGSNNDVSLTPKLQLAPQTTYTASLSPAITDLAGNALMNAPVEWSFTTGADKVAPAITTRFPEIDDSGIQVSASVTVRFSEPIIGLSTASMTLDQGGTLVPASVTYLPNVPAARLTPNAPLAPNTTYTVTLTSAITDASGNALAQPASWHFQTSAGS